MTMPRVEGVPDTFGPVSFGFIRWATPKSRRKPARRRQTMMMATEIGVEVRIVGVNTRTSLVTA
jgi:hypothetical protein